MPDRRRGISRARARLAHRVAVAAVALGLVALLPAAAFAFPGQQVWAAQYDGGVLNGFDAANAVAVSGDGTRVYVTGASASSNGTGDYATVAYAAATGAQLWVARYDRGFEDAALSIAVSPDGARVFVTGRSDSELGGASSDYATVAYARDGRQLWVRRYSGAGWDNAKAVAVSPDGSRVFVTGESERQGTSRDYLTIAYDAASGRTLWSRRYDGPASGSGDGDRASALAVSPDGSRVYVTGDSESSVTSFDYATIAYNAATGATVWLRRYNGPASQSDSAVALALNRAGTRLYVTGESDGVANNCLNCEPDYVTVGYRADTGARLWARRFGQVTAEDRPTSVAVSPKGFVVVTGESRHQNGFDYATIAYGTGTGVTAWVDRYDFAHRADVPYAVGVSPDGARAYVTGESVAATGYPDVATLSYDAATGARAWISRYDDELGSQDWGSALAVAPDGEHLFVAGATVGDPGFEYLTVAYAG
jgi:DNA-binding beta-propeller fold protein YncE